MIPNDTIIVQSAYGLEPYICSYTTDPTLHESFLNENNQKVPVQRRLSKIQKWKNREVVAFMAIIINLLSVIMDHNFRKTVCLHQGASCLTQWMCRDAVACRVSSAYFGKKNFIS